MARSGMRDVILADDGDPDAAARATTGSPDADPPALGVRAGRDPPPDQAFADASPRAAHGRPGPRRRWLVGGAVVLAVAGVAVVQGERGADSAALLSDHPFALQELTPAFAPLWEGSFGWENMLSVGVGDLLIADDRIDDVHYLMAFETATGAERWRVPIPDPAVALWSMIQVLGDPAVEGTTHVALRAEMRQPGGPVAATLLVFDADDGALVRQRPLATARATLAAFGPDLLVVDEAADGHLEAVLEDPGTGEERWRFRSLQPVPLPGGGAPMFEPQNGYLVADGPAAVALAPDGSVVWEWGSPQAGSTGEVGRHTDLTVLPDGRVAVSRPTVDATGGAGGIIEGDPGDDPVTLPGPVLALDPDDGTAGDVILTQSSPAGVVIAVDAASGDERWRASTGPLSDALLLDRRLILNTGARVLAIDTGDGRTLWEAAEGLRPLGGLYTDGRLVLVPTRRDRTNELTALDPTDGRVRWSVPAPDAVRVFWPTGGRLLAIQQRTIVALGSPSPATR